MRINHWLATALAILSVTGSISAQTTLYSENFDSYALGAYITLVSPQFVTWSGAQGGAEDVQVTDVKSASSPHSLMWSSATPQGDQDIVLKLDNKMSGVYEVTFKILVGTGATEGAYFNMLQTLPPSPEWAFSLTFLPDLTLGFNWNNIPVIVGSYTKDVWNDIKVKVNLDQDSAWLWMNGMPLANWIWSTKESGGIGIKQLAGVNFFSYAGGVAGTTVKYYVDDILYVQHVVNPGMQETTTPAKVMALPNPAHEMTRFTIQAPAEIALFSVAGAHIESFYSADGVVNISSLQPGVYFARIQTGNQMQYLRFVKQ
jgi:hypothetical protein